MRCKHCHRFSNTAECDVCTVRYNASQEKEFYQKFLDSWEIPSVFYWQDDTFNLMRVEFPNGYSANIVRNLGIRFHYIFDYYEEDGDGIIGLGYRGSLIHRPRPLQRTRFVREIGILFPRIQTYQPMHQTQLVEKHGGGNCMATCAAMLLGTAIPELPKVEIKATGQRLQRQTHAYFRAYNAWLASQGYIYAEFNIDPDAPSLKQCGYHVVVGLSPRNVLHAVIGHNGKCCFDPHPSSSMVSGNLRYGLFIKTYLYEDHSCSSLL